MNGLYEVVSSKHYASKSGASVYLQSFDYTYSGLCVNVFEKGLSGKDNCTQEI